MFPSQIQTFSALPGNHPTPPPFYSGCLQESGLPASRCCPHQPGPFRPRQSLPPTPAWHCLLILPEPLQVWGSEQRAEESEEVGSRVKEGANSPFACKAPVSLQTMMGQSVSRTFSQKCPHHTFVIISGHRPSFLSLFTHQARAVRPIITMTFHHDRHGLSGKVGNDHFLFKWSNVLVVFPPNHLAMYRGQSSRFGT